MAGSSAASWQADPALAPVPVIVLSARRSGARRRLHAAAFLKKPLDFDRLLDLVRTLLPLQERARLSRLRDAHRPTYATDYPTALVTSIRR